jgi:alkaline phosphatase
MKTLLTFCFSSILMATAWTQTPVYSCLNGHSHNDYRQKQPFETAFEAGMGSIEADVFLEGNTLYVAHTASKINPTRTLDNLYLKPIVEAVRTCKNYPMQIVIDIKTHAETTLNEIVRQLSAYPDVFNDSSAIKIVISGHRPNPKKWLSYPCFIQFDGRPYEFYSPEQWERVGMVSDKFKRYANRWHKNICNRKTFCKMEDTIEAVHAKGKKIRFWQTPDNQTAWETLITMRADFINTDSPNRLKKFLACRPDFSLTFTEGGKHKRKIKKQKAVNLP